MRVSFFVAVLFGNTVLGQHSPTSAFEGKIGKTIETTTEAAPKINPKAPAGAPNIVWIQIDDIGYGRFLHLAG
ncbi:hypothetical protein MUK70_08355 [Dyadobacter chenwenxiniae]|uniref:Sulfatase n=1 Tax=Dyadobacter chenwenxiniae TaxID=2906456 RepID=A0A9X1TFM1_9BACT|nr:hypothetical protein [Dyadobacter chenwenxiniae]MCF0062830.1 hypothetical protein [Dyadobacter chenwenxiniae]UON84995.1 hypothetical protein MUK70_08355 [Dyadobacter chenwenxiniae]